MIQISDNDLWKLDLACILAGEVSELDGRRVSDPLLLFAAKYLSQNGVPHYVSDDIEAGCVVSCDGATPPQVKHYGPANHKNGTEQSIHGKSSGGTATASRKGKANRSVDIEFSVGARSWVEGMGLTEEDIISMVGAPNGTGVKVSRYGPAAVQISVDDGGDNIKVMDRVLFDDNGELAMEHELFTLTDSAPSGYATKIMSEAIPSMEENGVKYIKAFGIRSNSWVGYYVWPKFGFDAPIEESGNANAIAELFPGVEYISDLYKTQEGRDWWLEYGDSMDYVFDMSEGSRSRDIFNKYMERKGLESMAKSYDGRNSLEIMKYFTPDEEKILDGIFDELLGIDMTDEQRLQFAHIYNSRKKSVWVSGYEPSIKSASLGLEVRDGDGDGFIHDGTELEQPTPQKSTLDEEEEGEKKAGSGYNQELSKSGDESEFEYLLRLDEMAEKTPVKDGYYSMSNAMEEAGLDPDAPDVGDALVADAIKQWIEKQQGTLGADKGTGMLRTIGNPEPLSIKQDFYDENMHREGKEEFVRQTGLDDDSELAKLAGLTDTSHVKIRMYEGAITSDASGDTVAAVVKAENGAKNARYIFRGKDGELRIYNSFMYVKDGMRGQGMGTKVLARQVQNAIDAGVVELTCEASRSDGLNGEIGKSMSGYFVWPMLGYDGPAPDIHSDRPQMQNGLQVVGNADEFHAAVSKLPDSARNAEKVSDFYKTVEGRNFWYKYGSTFSATFDLREGSDSLKRFNDYLDKRDMK